MTKLNKICVGLWLVALIAVTVGSLLPINDVPSGAFVLGDKALHGGAYFCLGLLALLAAREGRQRAILLITTFAVSVLIEFIQPLTGRSFEILDMVANGAGLILALPLFLYAILPTLMRLKLK